MVTRGSGTADGADGAALERVDDLPIIDGNYSAVCDYTYWYHIVRTSTAYHVYL